MISLCKVNHWNEFQTEALFSEIFAVLSHTVDFIFISKDIRVLSDVDLVNYLSDLENRRHEFLFYMYIFPIIANKAV